MWRKDFTPLSHYGNFNWGFICIYILSIWIHSFTPTRSTPDLTYYSNHRFRYCLPENSKQNLTIFHAIIYPLQNPLSTQPMVELNSGSYRRIWVSIPDYSSFKRWNGDGGFKVLCPVWFYLWNS